MDPRSVLSALKELIVNGCDLSEVKGKLLELYTDIQIDLSRPIPTVLTFVIPSISSFPDNPEAGLKFEISVAGYREARNFYVAGKKIQSIKSVRLNSKYIDSIHQVSGGLGLRSSKDFVEGHSWNMEI